MGKLLRIGLFVSALSASSLAAFAGANSSLPDELTSADSAELKLAQRVAPDVKGRSDKKGGAGPQERSENRPPMKPDEDVPDVIPSNPELLEPPGCRFRDKPLDLLV